MPGNYFHAQVVAPDDSPLAFAKIKILKDKMVTSTDGKGKFNIVSSDSLLNIEVSSAGYSTKQYNLKSNADNNKIILEKADVGLSEVVVTGISSQTKEYKKAEVFSAAPANGWESYNTYILKNKVIPLDAKNNNIHGDVEISFIVKRNGKLSNIQIDKPLIKSCDEEAIRLFKTGPEWKPANNARKSRGKIKITF
jgi:TonB family protein